MTTARDLITKALKKIGVLGIGDSLSAEDAQDGLDSLNDLIASWSTQNALIYTETKETFNLNNSESYTIGSGQNFDTIVPRRIRSAYVNYADIDNSLKIIGLEEYSSIIDKDDAGVPVKIYFDSNYPVANIYVWPVGYTGTTLTLFSEKPLIEFTDLDTMFDMPSEYRRAIIYNLAVEVSGDYERQANGSVKRIAVESLSFIKNQNKSNDHQTMSSDGMLGRAGGYDIYSGTYR